MRKSDTAEQKKSPTEMIISSNEISALFSNTAVANALQPGIIFIEKKKATLKFSLEDDQQTAQEKIPPKLFRRVHN